MAVTVAKIIWTLIQPLSFALLLMVLALLALWAKKRVLCGVLLALDCGLFFLMTFTSLGYLLIATLEDRMVRPAQLPEQIAGIIVLGGGIDGEVGRARDITELTAGGDRFVEGLRLALTHPEAKIIISGGFGSLIAEGDSDATAAERFYTGMGIAHDRLVLEGQSRSTAENAEMTQQLLGGADNGPMVLVTSAFHMPRATAFFRGAGVDVISWPVDYRSTGQETFRIDPANPPENLLTATVAIREWIALLIYWSTGQIDSIYPQ